MLDDSIDVWHFVLRCCIVAFFISRVRMIVPWWRIFFPSVQFSAEKAAVFSCSQAFWCWTALVTLKLQVPQFWGGWQNVEKKLWKFAARHEIATMTTRLATWNQESLQFVSVATSCFGKNRPLSFRLQSSSSPEAWCAETMFWFTLDKTSMAEYCGTGATYCFFAIQWVFHDVSTWRNSVRMTIPK